MWLVVDVDVIVPVQESVAQCLAEYEQDGKNQETADGNRPPGVGSDAGGISPVEGFGLTDVRDMIAITACRVRLVVQQPLQALLCRCKVRIDFQRLAIMLRSPHSFCPATPARRPGCYEAGHHRRSTAIAIWNWAIAWSILPWWASSVPRRSWLSASRRLAFFARSSYLAASLIFPCLRSNCAIC